MDKKITLEINGQNMHPDTYEVIEFLNGEVKIKAVFHDAPGFKEHIQQNPEQFNHEDHSVLFDDEEELNLSQSMRP